MTTLTYDIRKPSSVFPTFETVATVIDHDDPADSVEFRLRFNADVKYVIDAEDEALWYLDSIIAGRVGADACIDSVVTVEI